MNHINKCIMGKYGLWATNIPYVKIERLADTSHMILQVQMFVEEYTNIFGRVTRWDPIIINMKLKVTRVCFFLLFSYSLFVTIQDCMSLMQFSIRSVTSCLLFNVSDIIWHTEYHLHTCVVLVLRYLRKCRSRGPTFCKNASLWIVVVGSPNRIAFCFSRVSN